MVSVKKTKIGKKTFYYLRFHTADFEKTLYLGDSLPKDLAVQKTDFELECYRVIWNAKLEQEKKQWMQYKIQHKSIIKKELERFRYSYIYNTQRIEGSTLTRGETFLLLSEGLTPNKRPTHEVVEAQQHEELFNMMLKQNADITKQLILDWHYQLFFKTDSDGAGMLRHDNVGPAMGQTEYSSWDEVEEKLDALIKWYNKEKSIINPVELAGTFHKRFELIHPFIDGNGRIGRMFMLLILQKNNYPLIEIETKEKLTYFRRLELSWKKNSDLPFLKWFIPKYLKKNQRI